MYHTSPAAITEPKPGMFGDFLCFSDSVYVQTESAEYVTYQLNVSEDEIIRADKIWYQDDTSTLQPFVDEIIERYGVSGDDAEGLLDESKSIYDVESSIDQEDLAEASWEIQRMTAEAGRALGYGITAMSDEQGTVYLVDVTKYLTRMNLV